MQARPWASSECSGQAGGRWGVGCPSKAVFCPGHLGTYKKNPCGGTEQGQLWTFTHELPSGITAADPQAWPSELRTQALGLNMEAVGTQTVLRASGWVRLPREEGVSKPGPGPPTFKCWRGRGLGVRGCGRRRTRAAEATVTCRERLEHQGGVHGPNPAHWPAHHSVRCDGHHGKHGKCVPCQCDTSHLPWDLAWHRSLSLRGALRLRSTGCQGDWQGNRGWQGSSHVGADFSPDLGVGGQRAHPRCPGW